MLAKFVQTIHCACDADNDGVLVHLEVIGAVCQTIINHEVTPGQFDYVDTDGSESITVDELMAFAVAHADDIAEHMAAFVEERDFFTAGKFLTARSGGYRNHSKKVPFLGPKIQESNPANPA